jgi:HPt (histidine-containing phosphotransfer) domain-containing protein
MNADSSVRLDAVRQHLNREYGMEGADLDDLVAALKSNLLELGGSIQTTLAAGQWPELSRHGHSLKGVAANVGQDELRQIGLSIEQAGKAGDATTVRAQLPRLAVLLRELGAG